MPAFSASAGLSCGGAAEIITRSRDGRRRIASLDGHLYGCIIQRTYGFGLAPLRRGKLLEGQEREEGESERFRELAKGALIERSDFPDEALGVEEANLGKVRDCITILNLSKREVVTARAWVADKRDAEEGLGIERADNQDWTIVLLARAIELVADIDTDRRPPDLARMVKRALTGSVHIFLASIPAVEVFLHTCGECSTRHARRLRLGRACFSILRRYGEAVAGLAERQEIAIRVREAAFHFADLLVGKCDVVIVAGAVVDDGARGGGLHFFRQVAQDPHGVFDEFAHDRQYTMRQGSCHRPTGGAAAAQSTDIGWVSSRISA